MFGRKKKQEGWKDDYWQVRPLTMYTIRLVNEKGRLEVNTYAHKHEIDNIINLLLQDGYKEIGERTSLASDYPKEFHVTKEEPQ